MLKDIQDFKRKKVAFIGVGVSNNELIHQFLDNDIDVTILDKNKNLDKSQFLGANIVLGENYLDNLEEYDCVIRSPGVYFNNPKLINARQNGTVITSEMELFFAKNCGKSIAVTGSDGKTTTTTLIAKILEESGKTVHLGGNIGRALAPITDEITPNDVSVVELSSFQLLSFRYAPDVSVITNISPNHLDVHGTMDEYISAKKNIFLHQNEFSTTVLNADEEMSDEFLPYIRGNIIQFSLNNSPTNSTFLREDGFLCHIKNGLISEIMHKNIIKIPGTHNIANYSAAISAVLALYPETPIENIKNIAENFNGVEHRIEFVRELDGVKWYNDSIATSPTRVLAGLKSFSQQLTVIAGGYDKKIPFEPMAETINEKVKNLILIGETAEKIAITIKNANNYTNINIQFVESMEKAVQTAYEITKSGDIITLSPACASFDMYPNFEKRGQHFKKLVNNL